MVIVSALQACITVFSVFRWLTQAMCRASSPNEIRNFQNLKSEFKRSKADRKITFSVCVPNKTQFALVSSLGRTQRRDIEKILLCRCRD